MLIPIKNDPCKNYMDHGVFWNSCCLLTNDLLKMGIP